MKRADLLQLVHYDPKTGSLTYRVDGHHPIKAGAQVGHAKKHPHNGKSYRVCILWGKRYLVHRVIWFYVTGEWPSVQIDHADGNGLNNAWTNLSLATHADNCKNQRKRRDNKTGHTGIRLAKSGKYMALITTNRKQRYLGTFTNIEEAIAVRKAAEKALGFHPNHGMERPL